MHGPCAFESPYWTTKLIVLQLTKCNCFVGIDLIGPLTECEGKRYIATAVCYFTKYIEAKAIPEKTEEQIAWFIYELMARYGIFRIALSDQGV